MGLKEDLQAIQSTALHSVDPALAVRRSLLRQDTRLSVNAVVWDLEQIDRVFLIAVGKAAPAMAAAAVALLGEYLTAGVVLTKYHHAAGYRFPNVLQVIEAGHPVPDAAGLRSARTIAALLADTTIHDRVLVLLSGGGSALLTLPVAGVTLEDLQVTTDLLLRAGATINELNTVRKHLSAIKGGQLARLAAPASVISLILSDVVGDPLDVIASGPTAPDNTTYHDALSVLTHYTLLDCIPGAVRQYLESGARGTVPETPKPEEPLFSYVYNCIVGSNRLSALAAVAEAQRLGYHALLLSTFVEGEAREVAKVAAALAKSVRYHNEPLPVPACLVWGGETTVTVRGKGKGGRNQELALAAALALEGMYNVALLALATDGTDGPTDAAGAIIDGQTVREARGCGWDPRAALQENNAYPLLADTKALLRTGPTGTNVNDLMVLLIQ